MIHIRCRPRAATPPPSSVRTSRRLAIRSPRRHERAASSDLEVERLSAVGLLPASSRWVGRSP